MRQRRSDKQTRLILMLIPGGPAPQELELKLESEGKKWRRELLPTWAPSLGARLLVEQCSHLLRT